MYLLNMIVCTVNELDFLRHVTAKSSSFVISSSKLRFDPTLAIQADTSDEWANCFISTNEPNPWFRLEFKSVTSIFNVRLGIRAQPEGELPAKFNLTGMASLFVYVSNSSNYKSNDPNICGDQWTYEYTKIIDFKCKRNLRGRFVYVTVPSSSPTFLMICSIVLNRDEGTLGIL